MKIYWSASNKIDFTLLFDSTRQQAGVHRKSTCQIRTRAGPFSGAETLALYAPQICGAKVQSPNMHFAPCQEKPEFKLL